MSTEELRETAQKAIQDLPPKALEKVIALLKELNMLTPPEQDDDELIERIIRENREVLSRLAE
jgi:hypothetical protein